MDIRPDPERARAMSPSDTGPPAYLARRMLKRSLPDTPNSIVAAERSKHGLRCRTASHSNERKFAFSYWWKVKPAVASLENTIVAQPH